MKTLEELRHRISSVEDMQSLVSTMKRLAAARIRQFETAADATRAYSNTVDLALQALIRDQPRRPDSANRQRATAERAGYILFGSDQGFCGRFNELVADSAIKRIAADGLATGNNRPFVLTIGGRLNQPLIDYGLQIDRSLPVPKSVSGINAVIQEVIQQVETWQREQGVSQVELLYNRRLSAATYDVKQLQLVPLSEAFINQLAKTDWDSRSLPIFSCSWTKLFTAVVGQHLFLQVFRACAESLASENASRIAAMQQAEKNIGEKLAELNSRFNQHRQRSITEELLDIVSGLEAVGGFPETRV